MIIYLAGGSSKAVAYVTRQMLLMGAKYSFHSLGGVCGARDVVCCVGDGGTAVDSLCFARATAEWPGAENRSIARQAR